MSDSPALEVIGLTRGYGGKLAVDGLSFEVQRGEVLGLLGPNGAGKTTTLRSIAGVLPMQEGQVHIAGHDLVSDPVGAKRSTAWVPDDPRPFDALTVNEHMLFSARMYRIEDGVGRSRELLERFELSSQRDTLGSALSRGMRQKLALAQAWLTRPRVMLLDEPLTGLDPRGIRSARAAIAAAAAEGCAVVLSSHQLDSVAALADRLLILQRGKEVFAGTMDEARALQGEGDLEEWFLAATDEGSEAAECTQD
jgi:ABC-2 type transport system ATP-binding protein